MERLYNDSSREEDAGFVRTYAATPLMEEKVR